jgi:translation initiation factor 2A
VYDVEMDFYDTVKKNRKLGSNIAHCTINFGWSPDSRYFMTATMGIYIYGYIYIYIFYVFKYYLALFIAPRMNVDNGFKVFKYNGLGPIIEQSIEFLYDATWCPVAEGIFPDRPPSPRPPSGEEMKIDIKKPEIVKVAGEKLFTYIFDYKYI